MATIITAAKVAFGINSKTEVKRPHASNTKIPVIIPPIGVFTPDALFTAVLVKLPVVGIDLTKLPITLQSPTANISCVASKVFPFAIME